MGLIILDAAGNYDEEASLRANRAHLKMMEIGLAEQKGEPVDARAAAGEMTEVLAGLAGNVDFAAEALRKVEDAVPATVEAAPPEDGGYAPLVKLLRAT